MMGTYRYDYSEWVTLNGDRQNIRIRSQDLRNPVILFLHGGPGVCDRHLVLKNQSGLSRDFTLVMWDQRGSGKSFTRASLKQEVHVENYVADARQLVEYLCRKLQKESIILACHSWGTVIGLQLAVQHPEQVAAYIGQGQFVNGAENERLSWQFCLEEAKRLGDQKAVERLSGIAPADGRYPDQKAMMTQRDYLTKYGGGNYKEHSGMIKSLLLPLLKTKEYSLADILRYAQGGTHLSGALWDEVVACRFDETVQALEMPVLLTMGRHDYNTPAALAQGWFQTLKAPYKEWAWFEESAHSPIWEEPEKWGDTVRRFCLEHTHS